MPKKSAGLLMYRFRASGVEVLLIHPGGPFWRNKDLGAWSIPKGHFEGNEQPLDAAKREFLEETGFSPPADGYQPLKPVRQSGGKLVHAWAFEGDADADALRSNEFEREWPPGSGRRQRFPEADRAGWFELPEARQRILKAQMPFLDELERLLR